jgi:nucleoside-diphosphate-sugar epimerase
MRIVIMGAGSTVAKDLITSFNDEHFLELFSREPSSASRWMVEKGFKNFFARPYADFKSLKDADVIINFVGAGDPAMIQRLGADIFKITQTFDEMALDYINQHRECKYIFISSGAVFGDNFLTPADANKNAIIPINNVQPQHYYGIAKAQAEIRHRVTGRNIIDLRLYNYFSSTCNLKQRFMISDIIRAIQTKTVFQVDRNNIMRDYVGPLDFYQMIYVLMNTGQINTAIDCYSRQPVSKTSLLTTMAERYGLEYETVGNLTGLSPTGVKQNYYSTNTAAYALGYRPTLTSLETIILAADKILK